MVFASRLRTSEQRLREAWPWLVARAAATLVNPWGFRIYPAVLNLAGVFRSAPGSLNSATYIQEFSGVPITWQTFIQLFDVRHLENGNSWLFLIAVLLAVWAIIRKELHISCLNWKMFCCGQRDATQRYAG